MTTTGTHRRTTRRPRGGCRHLIDLIVGGVGGDHAPLAFVVTRDSVADAARDVQSVGIVARVEHLNLKVVDLGAVQVVDHRQTPAIRRMTRRLRHRCPARSLARGSRRIGYRNPRTFPPQPKPHAPITRFARDQRLRMMTLPTIITEAHSPQSCPIKTVAPASASVQSSASRVAERVRARASRRPPRPQWPQQCSA